MIFTFLTIVALMSKSMAVDAASARLATTTHYNDGLQGACGCGNNNTGAYSWQHGITSTERVYTAAANQAIFAPNMDHWCGSGCGKCYRLSSTGVSSCETCGAGGVNGQSVTVMVTNLCPNTGNEEWCANPGQLNRYGYEHHFDIMGGEGVFGDNVVVEFEDVACPEEAMVSWGGCECHPSIRVYDEWDNFREGLHTTPEVKSVEAAEAKIEEDEVAENVVPTSVATLSTVAFPAQSEP